MSSITVTFLVIGGIGLVVLAVSVFVADLLHFGHPDIDGPFSVPAVAGFLGSFGFVGAVVASALPDRMAGTTVAAVAAAAGLVAAVPTAWVAIRLSRAAQHMRTDATPTRADLVGTVGVVVTPIPLQGYGEVRVSLGGQPVKLNARADQPIARGSRVFVVEAPSSTSVIVEQTTPIEEV